MPTSKVILWLGAGLSLYLIAWNVGAGWLYVLTAAVTSYLLLSIPLSRLNTRKLQLQLASAPAATQGEPLPGRLTITNPGRLPRLLLELKLELAGGEARLLLPCLAGRQSIELDCEFNRLQRGVYQDGLATFSSAAPGGLWRSRRRATFPRRLVVYPRWFELSRPLSVRNLPGAHIGSRQGGARWRESEYLGVRGYQPQDSPKAIHWRSTARRGALTVVEYARPANPDTVVWLDTFAAACAGSGNRSSFEAAVALAASILRHELNEDRGCRLASANMASRTEDRPKSYDESRLWLAQVQADDQVPLPLDQTMPLGPEDSLVLLITSHRQYEQLAESALLTGHPGSLVVVYDGRRFAARQQDIFLSATDLSQLQRRLQAAGHRCWILADDQRELSPAAAGPAIPARQTGRY